MKSHHTKSFLGIVFWFFLAVFFYISILGWQLYQDDLNRPGRITRECQERTLESELKTTRRVASFMSAAGTGEEKRMWQKGTPGDDGDEDVFIFAYRNDTLVFWNNNSVILPPDFVKQNHGKTFFLRLGNGWYGFVKDSLGPFRVYGCYLVKNEFPFENDFIENKFSPQLHVPDHVGLRAGNGPYPVLSGNGNTLFSLSFDKAGAASVPGQGLVFALFLLASFSFLYFLNLLSLSVAWFRNRENLRVGALVAAIILLRFLQGWFQFPGSLYHSDLFSPALYSSSALLPSLGDYTLNALCLVLIVAIIHKRVAVPAGKHSAGKAHPVVVNILASGILLALFLGAGYLISDLVVNSSVSLNLQNISGLTPASGFGLFILVAILYTLWQASAWVSGMMVFKPGLRNWFMVYPALAVLLLNLSAFIFGWDEQMLISIFFLVYAAFFWFLKSNGQSLVSDRSLLFFLCFFSVFATFLLNEAYRGKEKEQVSLLAVKLATRRNPVTEILYEQVDRKLRSDSVVNGWLNPGAGPGSLPQDSLASYLERHYFKDYWKKYQVQVTYCYPGKNLVVQPQNYVVNCLGYFNGIIQNSGESTAHPGLFYMDFGPGKEYYLSVVTKDPFAQDSLAKPAIFIEFSLKNTTPDPGYPGLLMDNSRMETLNLSDYSYGLYQDGLLVRSVGNHGYRLELKEYGNLSGTGKSFEDEHVNHYSYRINKSGILLISRNGDSFLSLASPFPYLFILFSVILLIVSAVLRYPGRFTLVPENLRMRLQLSLAGILVLTMFAVGIIQVINITDINAKKNVDNLQEKAYSIVIEVQHKYGALPGATEIERERLGDFLVKLSNVFFTDINVFDQQGMLMGSSRPQIFQEGLLSERMDATAWRKLALEKNSGYTHYETIGKMEFNSAYLPFFNDQDQLMGYVNLPYFAKQDEAKKEISSFLVTFINVYILLILFGMFVIVLISNYITAPLATLAEKMSNLRLGRVNEKIPWRKTDEIGQLVAEYNRMIDELGRSAEMLAQSERESAWREMARQVAHEIKNPLTPMKLSVQYLEKAWREQAPDWDQRLARFTATLVEQIDALSVIASDFSAFAKMPAVELKRIDADEVARFVLAMYQDTTQIRFEYRCEAALPGIYADRPQIIRVLTNLLNNAVQAIEDPATGVVKILLEREHGKIVLHISDNGCGISRERNVRIFQPDFTTKTSGTGLGLAIVKGIVEAMSGTITFTSEEGTGTTFTLKFPEYGSQTIENRV